MYRINNTRSIFSHFEKSTQLSNMGIQDLYPVMKSAAPDHIKAYHLSEFCGSRFAVDISIFLYRYIRSAGPIRWMGTFIIFLCTLKRHGIKAVCIFDGPNPPAEKGGEQERRRSVTKRMVDRLEECIRMRNNLQDEYTVHDNNNEEVEPNIIKECRLLINPRQRKNKDATNYDDVYDIIDALNHVIERLTNQTLPITSEHTAMAIEIVRMFGLVAITADGEAETLCAYLAVKGQVDAVLTEDTDVLAYGTPLMLAFKDFKLNEEKLRGIHLPSLLEKMEMNQEEFRDLCILLSCDYNSRVKGYPPDGKNRKKPAPIGAKGALCMIQKYRRLEEVCKYVEDEKPLIYRRCRELFTIPKTIPFVNVVPCNKPPDYDKIQDLINKNNLTIKVDYIKSCHKPPNLHFDDSTDDEDEHPVAASST